MDFEEYLSLNFSSISAIDVSLLESAITHLEPLRAGDNTLWVAGNGGSASTASHFVADLNKTILTGGNSIKTIALSEMVSLVTAYSNDLSFEDSYSEMLKNFAKPGDLLLILSVSGKSPNLVKCLETGMNMGLDSLCIVGKNGQTLAARCDVGIVINSADYQIVENAHIFVMHWIAKQFMLLKNVSDTHT